MALTGEVAVWASVRREGVRQGMVTTIPQLAIMDITGDGNGPTFQATRLPFVFGGSPQGGGLTIRWRMFADWTQELEDAISNSRLNRLQPVETGDQLVMPDVPPGTFPITQADVYPGSHIILYTTTALTHAAG